jgi:hypothetical protein
LRRDRQVQKFGGNSYESAEQEPESEQSESAEQPESEPKPESEQPE